MLRLGLLSFGLVSLAIAGLGCGSTTVVKEDSGTISLLAAKVTTLEQRVAVLESRAGGPSAAAVPPQYPASNQLQRVNGTEAKGN